MTREEAKRRIEICRDFLANNYSDMGEPNFTAFNMAIQALSQESTYYPPCQDCNKKMDEIRRIYDKIKEQEPCDDAISREDAEQMFRNIRCHLKPQDYKSAEEFNTRDLMLLNAEQMIHALPSVMHKSGKWIRVTDKSGHLVWECNKCGWQQRFNTNFCPECGAKMQESEDKE